MNALIKSRPRLAGATVFVALTGAVVGIAWRSHHPVSHAVASLASTPAVPCALSLPADFMPRYLAAIRSRSGLAGPLAPGEAEDLAAQLESFNPSRLKKVAAGLLDAPDLDHDLKAAHLGRVLQLLEKKDPQASLALFEEMSPRFSEEDRQVIATAMLPMAATDAPEATGDWWTRHAPDFGASSAALQDRLFTWAALYHPAQAFALIEKLRITDLRSAGSGIGKAATTADRWTITLQAMRTYLAKVDDPVPAENLRQGVMAGFGDSLVQQPFPDALAWMESSLNSVEQHSLAESLRPYDMQVLPTPDSQQMAGWLGWLPAHLSPEDIPAKVEELVISWTRWFPDAAELWIAGSTEPVVKEAAIRGFVKQTAGTNPENANRVAMLLPDGHSRTVLLHNIEDARTLHYGYLEERSDP